MGGIGKTALAVEAAHRARSEGWFPGGFLFVDLRGYDDNPATADQGVLALLDAMGVRGTDLPPTTARQYDAYHALLADRRERMLLILDNASDPSQYLPLLPGTDHHRVLITSRDRPDSLQVRVIGLETLDPGESAALVTCALRDADERDDRPVREPVALRELTCLCGHLPLALQIAAAMLRRGRTRDIASLVSDIKKADDPSVVLDYGPRGTDLYGRSLALRPVLETSYLRLSPELARMLRLLCLAPGADTGTEAAAALAGLAEEAVLPLLDELAATHLVSAVRTADGVRWRLHDLVRAFGAGVVARDAGLREEGDAARERVLDFYYRVADAADDRLRWLPGMAVPERFSERAQAFAWLDRERAALVAAALWAREERFADTAARLAACLPIYLDWRRCFDDMITVCGAAHTVAQRTGDRRGEASVWTSLGIALWKTGRAGEAIDALTRARDLFHVVEDRHHEAGAWSNLGSVLREAGRAEESVEAHMRALGLYQALGDNQDGAEVWSNLGTVLWDMGRAGEAIDALTRARDLFHVVEDRHHEAIAWLNLGNVRQGTGRAGEAIEAYAKAAELFSEFEDWYRAGLALYHLAVAHAYAHRPAKARAHYLQAADAYTRANAPAEAAQARAWAAELD